MKVAVTGGTGFLGAHTVRALLDAGHEPRLLIRSPKLVVDVLGPLGVLPGDIETVEGDVADEQAVDGLLDGTDAVIHSAAMIALDKRQLETMRRTNVDGTCVVLRTAAAKRLDPIIHVSSYGALFPSPDPVIGPDSPVVVGGSGYGATKALAEHHARGMQDAGLPVVITYPSGIVGPPAGTRLGETAEGWALIIKTGWTVGIDGGLMLVDVRDLAAVHVAALEPGRGPRRYMCGGHYLSYDDVIDTLAEGAGVQIRTVPLPNRAFRGLALVLEKLGTVLPVPAVLTHDAAMMLTSMQPTDDSRTVEELGVTFRPAREALLQSFTGAAGGAAPGTG